MPLKDPIKRKEYQVEYRKTWYAQNRGRRIEEVKKRRAALRLFVFKCKASIGCQECPESNPHCLDFHHYEDKERCVSEAVSRGWAIVRLLKEMEKCFVLCANCHRKIEASVF